MKLKKRLIDTIQTGLERQTLNSCSRWAEKCRIMGGGAYPGPWTFKYHPWLRQMHDTTNGFCIGQKAAQMGYTEACLNRVFYRLDIEQVSVLYVLPAKSPDAGDFSSSRFDTALELSPYLQRLFSNVKNVGHKRAGPVSLYIRGSRSRAGLKSLPAGHLVFDELDEMTQDNIPLAFERQSGQLNKQTWMISTPTIDDYGINTHFKNSNQMSYFFNCPSCNRLTNLTFPDCIEITSEDPTSSKLHNTFYKCKECGQKLPHELKYEWLANGQWIPAYPNQVNDGFHINQMYSSTVKPHELAKLYLHAQVNAAHEQEFYNSKLGLPHLVAGAKIQESEIIQCIGNYKNGRQPKDGIVTIGIDVGNWLHYVVREYELPEMKTPDINMNAYARVLEIGKCLNFEDLDNLMYKYRPNATVIDANPERRKAFEFAQKYWGIVWLCFYGNASNGKQITRTKDTDGTELEQCVTVDRTSWLDLSQGRFLNKTVELPMDLPTEFKSHIKSLVRKPEMDKNGNPIAKYINTADDHYAHSSNYAEVALPLATSIAHNRNIRSPR